MSTSNSFPQKNQYETEGSIDADRNFNVVSLRHRKPIKTYYANVNVFSDDVPLKRPKEIGELYEEGL